MVNECTEKVRESNCTQRVGIVTDTVDITILSSDCLSDQKKVSFLYDNVPSGNLNNYGIK